MPCDSGMGSSDYCQDGYEEGKREVSKKAREDIQALLQEIDQRTDMLCRVLRTIAPEELLHLDSDIQAWYVHHQQYDKSKGR